jgi:ABC-2 type transport system permease protein
MFPPYLSGGFVPVETLPAWLQGFATHQLATGGEPGVSLLLATVWWTGLALLGFLLAARLFAARTG